MTSSSFRLMAGRPAVPLAEWLLSSGDAAALGVQTARRLSILGAKVPAPQPGYPDAWRSEYLVREVRADGLVIEHHLAQREDHVSLMWIAADACNGADVMADMVKPSAIPVLSGRLRWRRHDAVIPARVDGHMYTFLKQFHISTNATTHAHFHGGFSVYVFATRKTDDDLDLALFQQNMNEQTAEDHYRLEERITSFLTAPHDLTRVRTLIQAGGKDFHEFVLESDKSTPPILALLLEHAKTKTFKSAIQKRIAEISSRVDSP